MLLSHPYNTGSYSTSTDSVWPHAGRPETAYNDDMIMARMLSDAVEREVEELWSDGS